MAYVSEENDENVLKVTPKNSFQGLMCVRAKCDKTMSVLERMCVCEIKIECVLSEYPGGSRRER